MKQFACTVLLMSFAGVASAATLSAPVMLSTPEGPGVAAGSVTISDSPGGAVFSTDLQGLPPGQHGMHVHAKSSCDVGPDKAGKMIPAGAAGGHMDPAMAGKHLGPQGMGHLGDLPVLMVAADGSARVQLTAPHIGSVEALRGYALVIHGGGDNYSDTPAPLGGGGPRIACGIIG